MLYLFNFGNLPDPQGLGCARTLRYAWLYPRQSQASLGGYYGGNPRTSQKIANVFSKYFRLAPKLLVSLEEMDVSKQLRYGVGRVVGPPTPPGYGTPSPPHAYIAYECEIPRRRLSKSHTRTWK